MPTASRLTEEQVIKLMQTEQGEKSLREFAAKIGITPAYLSDIYKRRRSPGKTVLNHFGLAKTRKVVIEYSYSRK